MHVPLLLFVCTGNICRSPMAQAIAQAEAQRGNYRVRIASAGMAALDGNGLHEDARDALFNIGVALVAHRARQLTRELVDEATLVVTATERQRDDLRHFFRKDHAKIVCFHELTGEGELTDPFGGGPEAFAATATALRNGMPAILARICDKEL